MGQIMILAFLPFLYIFLLAVSLSGLHDTVSFAFRLRFVSHKSIILPKNCGYAAPQISSLAIGPLTHCVLRRLGT